MPLDRPPEKHPPHQDHNRTPAGEFPPPHQEDWDVGGEPSRWLQRVGLVAGLTVFAAILAAPVPSDLPPAAWCTGAVGALMAIWWMTEALPIPATSLLPLVLFPLLGARSIGEAAAPFANPLIYLFMGGFIIALAMERWGLHRRIALNVIRATGTGPRSIILGFMISGALLSMWLSNTATAVMMLPIGTSVIALTKRQGVPGGERFGAALMLGIAYGCSIGGTATLIGTPPNAVLAGFLSETYGYEIGFAQWMQVGVPLMILGLPLVFLVLTRLVFPINMPQLPGGRELIEQELRGMGRITSPERKVLVIFTSVALLWITRRWIALAIPGIEDAVIAIAGALLMFIVPAESIRGRSLLSWDEAERLPWGVLLIFGGGLSLAAAISETGLAKWIGEGLHHADQLPLLLLVLLVTALVVLLTELTSNTATATAFLPIVASVGIGIGENPLLLAVPVVFAASCAFMLPVATPPNAIVYGSGAVTIGQMVRAGMVLNVLFTLLIAIFSTTLGAWVFGIEPGTVPEWAQ